MPYKSAWFKHWERLTALLGQETVAELRSAMQRDSRADYLRKERKLRLDRVAKLLRYDDPLSPLLRRRLDLDQAWLDAHPDPDRD